MKRIGYKHTVAASFTTFVVQAVVNNFAPLLFLTFQAQYGIELSKITVLITANFFIQIFVDLTAVLFVDRIGYRASTVLAHAMCATGLIFMMLLSGCVCTASYFLISLTSSPILGLVGVAVCGLSAGILWPGTIGKMSSALHGGGTAMYAILCLGGDIGCSAGPTFAGMMASFFGDDLKKGILCAVVFPLTLSVIMLVREFIIPRRRKKAAS